MFYLHIFFIFFFLSFCHQKDNSSIDNNIVVVNSPQEEIFVQEEEEDYILKPSLSGPEISAKISELIDFKLGDGIQLDSAKRFLQISILFTLTQNSNYYTISHKKNVTDEEISNYLDKKRMAFYKKLGISETEYINYSINNSEDIQEFLAVDSEFAQLYEIIQSYVTD